MINNRKLISLFYESSYVSNFVDKYKDISLRLGHFTGGPHLTKQTLELANGDTIRLGIIPSVVIDDNGKVSMDSYITIYLNSKNINQSQDLYIHGRSLDQISSDIEQFFKLYEFSDLDRYIEKTIDEYSNKV